MNIEQFNYDLPESLIAKRPTEKRDECRLLTVDTKSDAIEHKNFYDILDYLKEGDCLVMNNSKVIPARLFGIKKSTGAKIELLLTKKVRGNVWETLVKPGKRIRIGDEIALFKVSSTKELENIEFKESIESELVVKVIDYGKDGTRIVEFEYDKDFDTLLDEYGNMPLPPYIDRKSDNRDKIEYQTVYCDDDKRGSVASPTAGLHFTNELITEIKARDIKIVYVTLNVGIGTFRPVKCENIEDHLMHFEEYFVSSDVEKAINETIVQGGRVVCVGTTSCRTLESASYFDEKIGKWLVKAGHGKTDIFIYPGYDFKIIKALITNFHLPKSTLLMLISALYDREKIIEIYNTAVKEKYRFFSYGDAMFIY